MRRSLTITSSAYRDAGVQLDDCATLIIFFGKEPLKSCSVYLGKEQWECVTAEKRELEAEWFGFLLRHLCYRAPETLSSQLHVTSPDNSVWLQAMVLEREGMTLDELVDRFAHRIRSPTGAENTLIVPYGDRGHWSLFVVEKDRVYHFDPLPGIHDQEESGDFYLVVVLAWAKVRGYECGSKEWKLLVEGNPVKTNLARQKSEWECGYAVCYMLWQYLVLRGTAGEAPSETLLNHKDWLVFEDGRSYVRWAMEALYCEVRHPSPVYGLPRIPSTDYIQELERVEREADSVFEEARRTKPVSSQNSLQKMYPKVKVGDLCFTKTFLTMTQEAEAGAETRRKNKQQTQRPKTKQRK